MRGFIHGIVDTIVWLGNKDVDVFFVAADDFHGGICTVAVNNNVFQMGVILGNDVP